MKPFRAFRGDKGFTLVELLVAAALMGIVVIAITNLFIDMKRGAHTQEEIVEVQQNLRVAMDAISRDLRMAGFLVPKDTSPISAGTSNSLTLRKTFSTLAYARLSSDRLIDDSVTPADEIVFEVATSEMVDFFSKDDNVRILRPQSRKQPIDEKFIIPANGIHRGGTPDTTTDPPTIKLTNFTKKNIQYKAGDIIIKAAPGSTSYLNTITYSLMGNELKRGVNGTNHVVADKINNLEFKYIMDDGNEVDNPSKLESIKAVRVTLTGQTSETVAYDGITRQRQISSVIKLRNR